MTIQTFAAGQTLTASQMNTLQASDFNFTRNVQTGTAYTLVITDRGKLLEFSNAGAVSLTIPTNAAVAFEIGDRVDVLLVSTGSVSIVGASGVTIAAEGGLTTISSQWTRVTLIKRTTDDWVITGGSGEVQTAEIENSAITEAKIATGAVTETKLGTGAVTSAKILDGTIVNADINASAAIELSKLATGALPTAITIASANIVNATIVNEHISASAAISLSKLATSTAGNIIVYNSSGVPTAVAETGDVTISDTGVTAIASGVIVDADINASAAIDKTKISGTAITAADSGTVTSTMIADGTIVNADINATAAIALGKLADATIDIKTGNYTLQLTDKNKFIKMNITSTANTVTIPLDSTITFPEGAQIHIIQYGSGKTQVVGASGSVIIYSTPGSYLRAQYSSATLLKCAAANTWMLMGDLSAS
jgi:urease beta subunit/sporulation protein YlmC with PRC-barrel domain